MNGRVDLWRCGICGEIREGNWGLRPVLQPDGWRRIACPECRASYPQLHVLRDRRMYADYPPPLTDDRHGLPFGLDEWLNGLREGG
jgi:hypothetical protein